MTTVAQWRDAAPHELAEAFALEARRWSDVLTWDTAAMWPRLDAARLAGRAGGAVTRAADTRLTGWASWAARGDELHCGNINAATDAETAALVAMVVGDADRTGARRTVVFAYSAAPGLADALGAHGFAVNHYEFLSRQLGPFAAARAPEVRTWDLRDLAATSALLRECYPAGDWARPFAPAGTPEAWLAYVRDLVFGDGCGRFRPTLSRAVSGAPDGADGVALVTDIGHGSAHLAQLAVRPAVAGHGLGRALVGAVRQACAGAGFVRLTLLVSDTNDRARRLYEQLGFEPRARFIAATRVAPQLDWRRRLDQPRRSTSEACPGGGDSTRR